MEDKDEFDWLSASPTFDAAFCSLLRVGPSTVVPKSVSRDPMCAPADTLLDILARIPPDPESRDEFEVLD